MYLIVGSGLSGVILTKNSNISKRFVKFNMI